jgi:ribonuclease HI
MSTPVNIYTDGAASGNPGPGGYGIILQSGKHYKEISEGFRLTTNNRMELMSVCVALETLKTAGCHVTVFSDSKYVVDSVEKKWIEGWIRRGWKNVKNPDLWKRYLAIASKHKVKFQWIRGHNGHLMNERCDELAVAAGKAKNLSVDAWYEMNRDKESLF